MAVPPSLEILDEASLPEAGPARTRSNSLFGFLLRRGAAMLAVLLLISIVDFLLLYMAPGDPVRLLLGADFGRPVTPAALEAVRDQWHLNSPVIVQYWEWLKGAVTFDFGTSVVTRRSVLTDIASPLVVTLETATLGLLFSLLIGVPLGVWAALRRGSLVDRAISGLSIALVSVPVFGIGLVMLYVFGYKLAWFPIYGAGTGLFDRLNHLILPALALMLSIVALLIKLTRAAVLRELESDYIVFARARGQPLWRVVILYAMRNALIPIVTSGGLVFVALITGTVLVEVTFSLPGAGTLLVSAVGAKDIPVIQALALVFAFATVMVNFGVDVLYFLIDPRMREALIPRRAP